MRYRKDIKMLPDYKVSHPRRQQYLRRDALATKVESQVISLVFTQALVTPFSLKNCANPIQLRFRGHFIRHSIVWRKG
jgi:hypothetical protein